MKISYDSKTGIIKYQGKEFKDLKPYKQYEIIMELEKLLGNNRPCLTDWDMDSMWMSYRYCIGRKTIAANMRAHDIKIHCYNKMSKERSIFTAFDINREIEDRLRYGKPSFWFNISRIENKIYTSALDCFFIFLEKYKIDSIEKFLNFKDINVDFDDKGNPLFSIITWDQYKINKENEIYKKYNLIDIDEDDIDENKIPSGFYYELEELDKYIKQHKPSKDYIYSYISDFEDLMIWNDLCHIFDLEHHHKSVLSNGEECEWFWTYIKDYDSEENRDNIFKFKKVRVPIDYWKGGSSIVRIADDAIIKDLW